MQAKAQGDQGYQQNRAFVVSDIWVKMISCTSTVSYLVNKATVEYVNDMNTLEQKITKMAINDKEPQHEVKHVEVPCHLQSLK